MYGQGKLTRRIRSIAPSGRQTLVTDHGATQVAPVPRFSHTRTTLPPPLADPIDVEDVVADWSAAVGSSPVGMS
jgi:hypothetical protein